MGLLALPMNEAHLLEELLRVEAHHDLAELLRVEAHHGVLRLCGAAFNSSQKLRDINFASS